ncbi:FG-GAP-like repeat-containing protein [Puia dinghuensis]|nr:FG-GAP-like repeat-containing protein [Puia dinghuensis]
MRLPRPDTRVHVVLLLLLIHILFCLPAAAQMRQIYLDTDSSNSIEKLSFFSPNEGYVAFDNWIGYTNDSGHTFTKRYILLNNVNYGPYTDINVTFGYEINGVKAFDRNNLIVYGDYGLVPAILSSSDGGKSFTLVFYSQFSPVQLRTGITDVSFPQNDNIGYAVDADRILKTTDKGLTWTVLTSNFSGSYFNHIEAADDNNLIVLNTDIGDYSNYGTSRILKTSDGGTTWSFVSLPALQNSFLTYAYFLDANKGWISITDGSWNKNIYGTTNGGATWTQLNNSKATPFNCDKMRFLDINTGYALVAPYEVYKTVNGGTTWEPLPRDNSYTYLGYTNNDLQWLSPNQLWAGGGHGFLEMSANGGGTPLPAPYFLVDTTGVFFTNTVTLTNLSRPGYQSQWIVNHQPVSTGYNATYTHDVTRNFDSIQLVNTSAGISDTLTVIQSFFVPVFPKLTSFYPATGSTGTMITIKGVGFSDVTGASFGNVPATSVKIYGDTMVRAVVGAGGTGNVTLKDFHGSYSIHGFTYFQPPASPAPVITSVNPTAGPVGTTVTISGSGFSGNPAQNSVFFGGVPATIQSASAGSIVCTVPAGAVYDNIAVLRRTDGLTGTSAQPFSVSFADSAFNFTRNSFTQAYTTNNLAPRSKLSARDLDGDGKPDLVGVFWSGPAAFRNISGNGHIRFAPQVNFGQRPYYAGGRDVAGDLDGDGLPDYVATSYDNYTIAYHNTSRPGAISFDTGFRVPVAITPDIFNDYNYQVLAATLADLDNDGRNDLLMANNGNPVGSSFISVARNTSSPGSISFGPTQIFPNGPMPFVLAAGDLDGDGFRDVVTLNDGSTTQSTVSCFRNTSSPGAISFALPVTLNMPGFSLDWPNIFISDFDRDGKPDIEVTDMNYLYVFRNSSTPGNLSFAPALQISLSNDGQISAMANFTGSYRPDIIVGSSTMLSFMWFKNHSSPGVFSVDSVMHYSSLTDRAFQDPSIGDFDQDGKPDLAVFYNYNNYSVFDVLRNTAGAHIPATMCSTGPWLKQMQADIPGKTHQWQVNTGSGFTNLTDNANISGSTTGTLQFILPPLSWRGNLYRCLVDSFYSSTFVLQLDTVIDPGVAITATDSVICFGKAATFSATDTSDNTNHLFQFQVNGQNVNSGYPDNTLTSYSLHDGDKVRVILLWADICQGQHADTSRAITVHVNESPDSVTISASDSVICKGKSVTFTATPVNPGSSPSYNWLVNGSAQGVNSPVFTGSGLTSGSRVEVWMTSSAACPWPFTAYSNALTITVLDTSALYVSIAASANNVCKGTPITFTATGANAGTTTAYQWLVNGVDSGSNQRTFLSSGLHNNDKVQCMLTSPATCRQQSTANSNVVVMTINDVVVPTVTVAASDTIICRGQTVIFTANPTGEGLSPAYQWNKNNLATGNGTSTYAATGLANGDAITVTLTSSDGCASPQKVTSKLLSITVNPIPTITITSDTTVAPGASVTLTSAVSNGGSNPGYQWQDSTRLHSWQNIPGNLGNSITYSPVDSGDAVKCEVTTGAGCSGTSNTLSYRIKSSPAGTSTSGDYRQYPNPVRTTLYIDNLDAADPITAVSILSNTGNMMLTVNIPGNQTKIAIAVAGINPGEYVVRVDRRSGKAEYFLILKL